MEGRADQAVATWRPSRGIGLKLYRCDGRTCFSTELMYDNQIDHCYGGAGQCEPKSSIDVAPWSFELAKGARIMPVVAPAIRQIHLAAAVLRRVIGQTKENTMPALGNAAMKKVIQRMIAKVASHAIPGSRSFAAIANHTLKISEKIVDPSIAAPNTASA